jgi:hypothetical protein
MMSLDVAAARLGIAPGRLSRWHHLGWAAADDYEEVGVPGVGRISARRWSEQRIEEVAGQMESVVEMEHSLREAKRLSRKIGTMKARHYFKVETGHCINFPDRSMTGLSQHRDSIPVCAREQAAAFLKEAHAQTAEYLMKKFAINFEGVDLVVSWKLPNWRELAYVRSGATAATIKIEAGITIVHISSSELFDQPKRWFGEYDFIANDPEIGSFERQTTWACLLRTYLHEAAHTAETKSRKHPPDNLDRLVNEEREILKATAEPPHGHGPLWSAIYRDLVRSTTLLSSDAN